MENSTMNQKDDRASAFCSAQPGEVRAILKTQLQQLWADPANARRVAPLMLWGPPGVGKSSVVRELCSELGVELLDIRLAQMDPVDIRGLPAPREDRTDWLLSGLWPREPTSRGVVLFDELTAVDRSVQVAVYELILDRTLGTLYELPPGWLVVAAGNRASDGAVATMMSSALANRFCHLEVSPDLEDWLTWARSADIHPQVMAFLRFRPGRFHDMSGDRERGWPSARSWERASDVLHQKGLSERSRELMLSGLVGPGIGVELMGFLEWAGKLPDARKMLDGLEPFRFPDRIDQRYAVCAALAHHLWHGPDEALQRRIRSFIEIGKRMPSDFAAMTMIDALSCKEVDEEKSMKLIESSEYEEWTRIHGDVFDDRRRRSAA